MKDRTGALRRTMIMLPAETHRKLKHLAVERDTSLAQVVREAVESLLAEDREDIARAEKILRTFRPGTGIPYARLRPALLRKARFAGR